MGYYAYRSAKWRGASERKLTPAQRVARQAHRQRENENAMAIVLWLFVVFIGCLPFIAVARVANVWLISGSATTIAVALGVASLWLRDRNQRAKGIVLAVITAVAAEIAIFATAAGLFSALVTIPLIGVFLWFLAVMPLAAIQWALASSLKAP